MNEIHLFDLIKSLDMVNRASNLVTSSSLVYWARWRDKLYTPGERIKKSTQAGPKSTFGIFSGFLGVAYRYNEKMRRFCFVF